MEHADVIPLYMKNNRQLKENYRPVSLLSALSKVFERTIHTQMHAYMLRKLLIYLCGFQKSMNAKNCVLFLVEKWREGLDKSQKCGVLLTDLSKAFDCLPHDLILSLIHISEPTRPY